MPNFPWGKSLNTWANNRALKSLDEAYQAAIAIQAIEEKHFNGQKIAPDSDRGVSVYNYFKTNLDRELLKVRWNLTQFNATNFLLAFQESGFAEAEILDKLNTIEAIVAKYRVDLDAEILAENDQTLRRSHTANEDDLLQNQELSDLEATGKVKTGFFKLNRELTPAYEQEVIQRLRNLRQQKRTAIRFLILLVIIPLAIQILTKNLIYSPLINHFKVDIVRWEKVHFKEEAVEQYFEEFSRYKEILEIKKLLGVGETFTEEEIHHQLKEKAEELLREAATKSQEGLKNLLADLTSLATFTILLYFFRQKFTIARQFFSRYFLGLSDVTKVFIFILLTDMFVGFHSSHGWEVILENLIGHFGLPENRQGIFLFIATVPVILDSTFKLLIFNYFTRQSPTAVAILEKMQK